MLHFRYSLGVVFPGGIFIERGEKMKFQFNTIIGIFGGIATFLWGGFPFVMQILVYFAVVDYVTGMYSAYITKTLSSATGFRGVIKKIFMFFICSLAYWIDVLTDANGILFSVVVFWYIGNEGLSIIENAIESGLKVPDKLKDAIQILVDGGEDDEN